MKMEEAYSFDENRSGIRFLENSECYSQSSEFSFPAYLREGTTIEHIKDDLNARKFYSRPTESYSQKMDFLRRNNISDKKKVVTVLGANWPIFYADLLGEDVSMTAVDENIDQVGFFDLFIKDPDMFNSAFREADVDFMAKDSVPYYPVDYRELKADYNRRLIKPSVEDRSREIQMRLDNEKRASILRVKIEDQIKAGNLNMIIADIVKAFEDLDLNGVDFIDLSNIPELIGVEQTQKIIDKLPTGVLIYVAFLTASGLLPETFVQQLSGVRPVDSQDTNIVLRQKMIILEKQ